MLKITEVCRNFFSKILMSLKTPSSVNPAISYIVNAMGFFQNILRNPPSDVLRMDEKRYFTESGLTKEYKRYLLFKPHFNQHYHEVTAIEGAEEALNFLLQEEFIQQPRFSEPENVTHEVIRANVLFKYLFYVIHEYINSNLPLNQINYEKLQEFHERYVYHHSKTENNLLVVAPIVGIRADSYPLTINDELTIEKLDIETKNRLLNVFTVPFEISYLEKAECCLKVKKNLKRGQALNNAKQDLMVRAFLTAARLYKEGDAAIFRAYTFPVEPEYFLGKPTGITSGKIFNDYYLPRDLWDNVQINNDYVLSSEDVDNLSKLYQQCKNVISGEGIFQALQIPLNRFHMTYTRESDDDKVIDLAIVIESTLLNGIKDELSNRIGLRGATLLGNSADPFKVRDLLKTLYDVRSKLVHEGKTINNQASDGKIKNKYDVDDFIPELKGVVRMILVEYLKRMSGNVKIKAISDGLENELLHYIASDSNSEN
ncbi:MAG: HEPN domain-containing protein [Calothrix sp. MO_167.B42]|nr:HEPN domain-containing protein [Calothrix sp. MO_167.B42]